MTHHLKLSVMTFNIRGGNKIEDGLNTWSNRTNLNIEAIVNVAPDVIGFQECQEENLNDYRTSLKGYACYLGHIIDNGNYNPLFWKATYFDCVEQGQFWLSPTPDAHNPHTAWNASSPRAATWIKLASKGKDIIVLIINTHCDHISEEARRKSVVVLKRKVDEIQQHYHVDTILLGDFNTSPWRPADDPRSGKPPTDEPYSYLISQGFIDSFLAAGNTDSLSSNTFHGFMGQNYQPWKHHMLWRPDWMLFKASHLQLQSCFIVNTNKGPIFPSDHYPVVANFCCLP